MKHQAQDKEARYAVVHECTLESIVLMDPATRKTEKVTIADFSKEWVVVMDAAEVQDRGAIVNWADMGGMKTGDHIDQRANAHVLICVHMRGRMPCVFVCVCVWGLGGRRAGCSNSK